ncbi:MAG: cation transporter [Methylococcaceae bacterium]|jgi:copper chaperone|nr:cation transporter [Methylococcaceae bacterium]
MQNASFKVTGMKCGGCEKTVQSAADAVPGVMSSKASSQDGSVQVEFDETQTNLDAIKQAVQAKGYPLA